MKKINKIKQIVIMAFFSTTLLSFGQINTTKIEELPYIEVIGMAEKEVIPDEIFIRIVIVEKYVDKVKISIEEQEEKLKNAVKSLDIDLSNLYLSDVNADYVTVRWKKKDVLTKKEYTLKVKNAIELGRMFQELEKLEITDAFISKVNHSKIDSLRKEVRILAIKAAKEKADYLLTAIGEQTGKPLIITENPQTIFGSEIQVMASRNVVSSLKKVYDNKETEIQFQKIKLTSSIYVKFSIK